MSFSACKIRATEGLQAPTYSKGVALAFSIL